MFIPKPPRPVRKPKRMSEADWSKFLQEHHLEVIPTGNCYVGGQLLRTDEFGSEVLGYSGEPEVDRRARIDGNKRSKQLKLTDSNDVNHNRVRKKKRYTNKKTRK